MLICLVFLTAQVPYGKAVEPLRADEVDFTSRWSYPRTLSAQADTFITFGYTSGDIVIFSYHDASNFEILNQSGTELIWSGRLDADEYTHQKVGEGVYRILCDKRFSVLIGDPISNVVQGWQAVDQNSRALSTKFLTAMQGSWITPAHAGVERFCVFAYYNNTDVTVKRLEDGSVVWSGTLDSLERWETRNTEKPVGDGSLTQGVPVSVEATKEVSVLSYGDCGYYAPAFNGSFTGRDFITFCGNMGGTNMNPWSQALKVIPWEDSTNVVVTDLDDPTDTIWKFLVAKRGSVQSRDLMGRFLRIHADKDISCAMVPGAMSCYYHLVRAIDRNGLGIGTEFYIPTLSSCDIDPIIDGKIDIFAFCDNTWVEINQMPDEGAPVWSGTLDAGGHHREMTDWAIYKVESSRAVAVIESAGDLAGADFLSVADLHSVFVQEKPVNDGFFELRPNIAEDVLYVSIPPGQHLELVFFDVLGRRVMSKTVRGAETSIDVTELPQGVYFVSACIAEGRRIIRKVVVCK